MGGMQISSWGTVDGSWGRAASFTLFIDGAYGIILLMKEKYMTSPSRPSALLKAGLERSYIILGMKQTYFRLGMDLFALVEMTMAGLRLTFRQAQDVKPTGPQFKIGMTVTFMSGVLKRVQDDVRGVMSGVLKRVQDDAKRLRLTGSQFKIGMTRSEFGVAV